MLDKKANKCGIGVILFLMTMVLTVILLPGGLVAEDFDRPESEAFLEKGQTLKEPGFFSGSLVQVNGTVEGTTFAAGREVQINGIINGDLFAAGQIVSINGTINGNIYAAGQDLRIAPTSTRDVFAAGQIIEISDEAQVERDLFTAGERISLDGTVQRKFFCAGSEVFLSGTVGEDANLDVKNVTLLDGALINGDLKYESPNRADLAPGSKVNGVTDWEKVKPAPREQKGIDAILVSALFSIASALLIWFLFKIWRPDFWTGITRSIEEQPLKTMGIGVLAFLLTPLLIILLMITVIGLPLGVILGLVYGVTIYLSKIIVAVFIGSWLVKRFGWTERHKGVWQVLLGLAGLVVLMKVPVLNVLVWLLVAFAGLGSLVLSKYKAPAKIS